MPGFSKVDGNGFRIYTRPEAKSGGHGIGWSEITPYSFKALESWDEVPVSIADPGGTEIDSKFKNEMDGELKVVLAPILRFSDQQVNGCKSDQFIECIMHFFRATWI